METTKKRKWKYFLPILIGLGIILFVVSIFYNKTEKGKEPPLDKVAIIMKSSTDPSKNIPHTPIKIVKDKKYKMTRMITCIISDTNWALIKYECNELLVNDQFGFIYGYSDTSKVWDITKFKNALDAFPEEGKDYVFEFGVTPGKYYKDITFTKFGKNFK